MFLVSGLFAATEDWILAAEKFTFSQTAVEPAIKAVAQTLPSLILEQMAENMVRFDTAQASMDKELYDLRSARLSLFLQLSKAIKSRDAVFLNNYSNFRLKSKVKTEEKKIAEIQKKISDNLETEKKIHSRYMPRIEKEKERQRQIEEGAVISEEDSETAIKKLFKEFIPGNEDDERVLRNVVFYQNDITKLFDAKSDAGYDSYSFEKSCVSAKISGLLTGNITVYGSYISVAVTLYAFPGAKIIGTAMEVGNVDDLKLLSMGLARILTPKITDSMPVELEFEIDPPEASENLIVTVDDVVYRGIQESLICQSGIHRIMFSAPGFSEVSTSYAFIGNRKFHVKANLTKKDNGKANLIFYKNRIGDVFANGVFSGKLDEENITTSISIDGKHVLGHFIGIDGQGADFFIPEKIVVEDAYLGINVKPFDRSKYIEKRRKLMYTSYSVLIVSLIPTFYCYGNSFATSRSYNINSSNNKLNYSISLEDAENWQLASNICVGISSACGVWFVYELVRYLQSANSVLPAKAKPINKKKLTRIQTKEEKRLEALRAERNKAELNSENAITENNEIEQDAASEKSSEDIEKPMEDK